MPTNIRTQMGFKAGLGAMDKIGYNMIFDINDVNFKTVTEKGGGYIQIDGVHTALIYFETPYNVKTAITTKVKFKGNQSLKK